jgi:hypothetical protein
VAAAVAAAAPDKASLITATVMSVVSGDVGANCAAGQFPLEPACCPQLTSVGAAVVSAVPTEYAAVMASAEASAPYCMLQIAAIPDPLNINPAAGPPSVAPPDGPGPGGSDS